MRLNLHFISKFKAPLFRNVGAVLSANVINNVAAFLITLHAAKELGPAEFGTFAVAVSVTNVLALVFDFGLSVTIVRNFNQLGPADGYGLSRAVDKLKIWMGLALSLALLPIRNRVAHLILPGRDAGWVVYASVVSALMLSYWTSIRALEQARNDFPRLSRLIYGNAAFRLAFYVGLRLCGALTLTTAFLSLYALPIAGMLALMFGITSNRDSEIPRKTNTPPCKLLQSALRYSLWVAISATLYMMVSRIPQFILARSEQKGELGIFGAALTFTVGFSMLNDALRSVILPHVSSCRTIAERAQFRRRHRSIASTYFPVMFLGLAAACAVQYWCLGPAYRKALPAFIVMGVAVILTIYIGLLNTLVHAIGKPNLDTATNVVRLAVLFVACILLPRTAMCASVAFSVVLVLGELTLCALIRYHESRVPGLPVCEISDAL